MTTAQNTPPAEATPHIYSAIRAIMDEVVGVAKAGEMVLGRGRNARVDYKFQKYDDMAAALGVAFRKQGVMIQAEITSLKITEWDKKRDDGSTQRNARVVIQKLFRFTSLVDGSTVQIEAAGEGADNSDKATNKAETSALKNALKQAFLLSTGEDDPDATRHDDTGRPVEQAVNDPWTQAERAVEQAARQQVQADQGQQSPPQLSPDQVAKAHKAVEAITQCRSTGDLDKLITWAGGWDLLSVRVDGQLLGARLIAAKATLPAGPPTHAEA